MSRRDVKSVATLAATSVLGVGYVPVAPGTFGTLMAIPLWWLLDGLPVAAFAAVVAALTVFAIWVAGRAELIYGEHDLGHIVIDEVVGMLACVIGVPFGLWQAVAAFVLFRALDITKPPPVGYLDRNLPGGLGVVLDDVAAGLIGCVLLHALGFAMGGWP